jgi:hypothetical protein
VGWFFRWVFRRAGAGWVGSLLHPAYGLRVGMDKATVLGWIGRPPKSTTSRDVIASGAGTIIIGSIPDEEYWLYQDFPPGHETRVVLAQGVLRSAEIVTRPSEGAPSDPPDVIRIDENWITTRRPLDAIKVVSMGFRDMPVVRRTELEAEYHALRQASGNPPLNTDKLDQIFRRLAADLERDTALPGYEGILIDPLVGKYTQLYSLYRPPGEKDGRTVAYRLWRVAAWRIAMVRSAGTSDIIVEVDEDGNALGEGTSVEETARRVAALVDAQERRYNKLTQDQRMLSINWQYLDQLVSSGERPEDWIRDVVEVRAIGHRLDREGGEELMRAVAYRAAALSQDSDTLPVIEMYWDMIGDWLA